jgi:hypothetical protein
MGDRQQAFAQRLEEIERSLSKRDAAIISVYSTLFAATVVLFIVFPFPLSRVGSVVLLIGFAYMIWRCLLARKAGHGASACENQIERLDGQIQFAQSMLFNVPFLVGANLFWMGLPGTGTAIEKAALDFVFLAGSIVVFGASYMLNQRAVRRELLPIRDELKRIADSNSLKVQF